MKTFTFTFYLEDSEVTNMFNMLVSQGRVGADAVAEEAIAAIIKAEATGLVNDASNQVAQYLANIVVPEVPKKEVDVTVE